MIKAIWAANRKSAMPDDEFYGWWHDVHGLQEFGRLAGVRRYVQHHTIAEARDGRYGIEPTRDGASIGWFDDFAQMREAYAEMAEVRAGWSGSRFDPQMDIVIAEEKPVVDGETTPGMVKGIYIFSRKPGLSIEEFQRHWYEVHGALWAKVPGVRRYVQNHAIPEAYEDAYDETRGRRMTHDGWSEVWFDDLEAMKRALASPEREAASEDGQQLLTYPLSIVVARETPIVGSRDRRWSARAG